MFEDVTHWPEQEDEQLGSKSKSWLSSPDGTRWLFKQPRPNSGEHWAERIAAEVATVLGIPHAHIQFAVRNDVLGTISRDFTQHGSDPTRDVSLLHGNQLLATVIRDYAKDAMRPPHHTVGAVLDYLADPALEVPRACPVLPHLDTAADAFVGYLLLDALVGNTDRHHENWGVLQITWQDSVAGSMAYWAHANVNWAMHRRRLELAPSYDHASSLGRDLSDHQRRCRLNGADKGMTVETYCGRGRTPLHAAGPSGSGEESDRAMPLTYREAFQEARRLRPAAATAWLRQLASVPIDALTGLVDTLPSAAASEPARTFAKAALTCNLNHLLSLER